MGGGGVWIAGLVGVCAWGCVGSASLCLFLARRNLPGLRGRHPPLCLSSGVSSLLLFLYLGACLLASPATPPPGLSLALGLVLSSFLLRPYLLRVLLLLSPRAPPPSAKAGAVTVAGGSWREGRGALFHGTWVALSLAVDLITALLASRFQRGSAGGGLVLPSPYLVLQDWYVFVASAALLALAALMVLPLCRLRPCTPAAMRPGGTPSPLVTAELLAAAVLFAFLASFYAASFSPSASPLFAHAPLARYYLLITLCLCSFTLTIVLPLAVSYRPDSLSLDDPGLAHSLSAPLQELPPGGLGEAAPPTPAGGEGRAGQEDEEGKGSQESSAPLKRESLEELLERKEVSGRFQIFLAKEMSAENLFFYRMVSKYRKPNEEMDQEQRLTWARAIADRYLRAGAITEVNVSESAKEEVFAALEENQAPPTLFNRAQREVFSLMERDSLPRFLRQGGGSQRSLYKGFINPETSSSISPIILESQE